MLLEYENDKWEKVVFCADTGYMRNTSYMLTDFEGGHGLHARITSVAQYPQDGETYVGSRVEARSITLRGWIARDKAANRIKMLEIMKPKGRGTLTLIRGKFKRRIRCVVERAPYFASERGDLYTILLYCPQPYWEEASGDSNIVMNGWQGLFEFPLEIVDGEGFEFGTRISSVVMNIENPGDAETGFIATFEAVGSVTNPEIVNVVTGQRMRFEVSMAAGDVLRVSTVPFDKWMTMERSNGTDENAMQYITQDFEFIQLQPGTNMLRAAAEYGGELLNTYLSFRALYLAV